jgi:hypothetical protein
MEHTMRRCRRLFDAKLLQSIAFLELCNSNVLITRENAVSNMYGVQESRTPFLSTISTQTTNEVEVKLSLITVHYAQFPFNIKFTSFKTCCTYYGQDCP